MSEWVCLCDQCSWLRLTSFLSLPPVCVLQGRGFVVTEALYGSIPQLSVVEHQAAEAAAIAELVARKKRTEYGGEQVKKRTKYGEQPGLIKKASSRLELPRPFK